MQYGDKHQSKGTLTREEQVTKPQGRHETVHTGRQHDGLPRKSQGRDKNRLQLRHGLHRVTPRFPHANTQHADTEPQGATARTGAQQTTQLQS